MLTPSPEIVHLLAQVASAFTRPTFEHAVALLYGTILACGPRTVAAALRALGLAGGRRFTTYHRVLNRAEWSAPAVSRILLALLCRYFLAPEEALVLLVDDTLERRQGRKIRWTGWFRDPVRSTANRQVTAAGRRWVCVMLLVPVPWSARPWARPLLTAPALAPGTSQKLGKRHRTTIERARALLWLVRRWQPAREIVLVGDGAYAAVTLGRRCRRQRRRVRFVSRLRLDAALDDVPAPPPPGKRGRKPRKGAPLPKLAARLADPQTAWQPLTVPRYGGGTKALEVATDTARWHRRGTAPLPIRWVLARCPAHTFRPHAFFCTDQEATPAEARAHLGCETQRQWADRAIARTTPCLLGLFSLVTLMARVLHPDALPTRQAAWSPKAEPAFADALAAVRRHLWASRNRDHSTSEAEHALIPGPWREAWYEAACYAA
jgi:DDE superfamily endonuclease